MTSLKELRRQTEAARLTHFKHSFFEADELPSTTSESGRVYHSPIGDLRSVTTILGERLDKTALNEWKKAVGEEEAAKQSGVASRHGTLVHDTLEKYIRNDPDWDKDISFLDKLIIDPVLPILRISIKEIFGIEYPLWSKHLRTAGKTDIICSWGGELAIADFKTSKTRLSYEDCIERGYFLQTTAYSIMLQERLGVIAPMVVIINIPEHEPPVSYEDDRNKFIPEVIRIFRGK